MVQWLEVINLRSAGNSEGLLEGLLRPMAKSNENRGLMNIKSYRHATLDTDLSLHLIWESERAEPNGSALGHQLARALKEFGLIDHSVWVYNHEK